MNKLSGYKEFTLSDGNKLEVKFSNGAYEIFGGLLGIDSLDEIDAALQVPTKEVDGQMVPVVTFAFLRTFRLFLLAGAKYAALVQGKSEIAGLSIDDVNEYMAAEWLEEIGPEELFALMPQAAPEEGKKKPMAQRIKVTQ